MKKSPGRKNNRATNRSQKAKLRKRQKNSTSLEDRIEKIGAKKNKDFFLFRWFMKVKRAKERLNRK